MVDAGSGRGVESRLGGTDVTSLAERGATEVRASTGETGGTDAAGSGFEADRVREEGDR